jgi:hypothetical protein
MPTNRRVPPDRDEIANLIRDSPPESFASHQLLDRVPWLFSSRAQYIEWKCELGARLGVDPFSLLLVGSACVGVSLSPLNGLRPFSDASDVDVAVVSAVHFDQAWRWLRDLGPLRSLAAGSFDSEMLKWHRKNLVFDGTIAADRLLGRLPFGPTWSSALGKAARGEPINGRSVKVRIYRDFESLRMYHVKGIEQVRNELLGDSADEVIPLSVPFETNDL